MSTSTELVQVEPLLPMSPDVAREALAKYRELTNAMLSPEDWQAIPNGRFVKRSGFQKIASGYGISTQIASESVDRDDAGKPLRAHAVVRATHPTGRYADGSGSCSIDESRFKGGSGRAKVEHDISATAVTRATNRAISNLVGFGQVSAEEIDGDAPVAASPYGPDGTADDDAKAIAIIDRLYPSVPGDQLVALINRQFGTEHLPQVGARMLYAIDWALGDERMRRAPENAPPDPAQSAYHETTS